MAAVQQSTSSLGQANRDALAAPGDAQRARGPASSSASIASSGNLTDGYSDVPRSTDGALDRLRSRTSDDGRSDTSSSHHHRMSRIFRSRKKDKKSARGDSQDDLSHHSDAHAGPPPVLRQSANLSDESLALYKSTPSSLLTDSDTEAPPPRRPGISPHQSHAGLLTLSSPLIASETVQAADVSLVDSVISTQDASTQPSHPSDSAAPGSPVSKLKDAFAIARNPTSPKKGGDTDAAKSGASGSGGGFGTLFGGKKREQRAWEDPLQTAPPRIQVHTGSDTQSTNSLRSLGPRRIVTQIPATPPNVVGPPTTFVTPPTPIDPKGSSPTDSNTFKNWPKHTPSHSSSNVTVSPSGNMISHRRVRSATNPSKLSNSTTVPLTPHIEEVKTPGGTAVSSQSGGFFSSVFSAAQNAATTLGKTITDNAATKSKLGQPPQTDEDQKEEGGGEEVIGPENVETVADSGAEKRRPAVETLGSGNLSLAHLGIAESTEVSPMSSSTNITMKADEASAKVEDIAAAQAVSAAYVVDKPPSVQNERRRSIGAASAANGAGASTPPRHAETIDSPAQSSVQRNGSIRSRLSDSRKRRHRGSSAATSTAIGAVIGASTSTLVPSATLNGQRLNGTGFAVASPKRNRDFHNLFKSVPEDDYLIEDYSAALQKEILLHGRLYVSEGHLCFSSNILGWVTNLVMSFDEVVSVEKKSTAMLFPNAIVIQTLHARNIFASLLARDSTYDLIIGIWKISHPNLKSSLNGVALDGSGTGDKTEKADSVGSDAGSSQDSDDDVYDEDAEDDDGVGSFTDAAEGSMAGSEIGPVTVEARKASAAIAQAVGGGGETAEAAASSATTTNEFPGAATHGPTECGDNDQHYDKLLIDTSIPAPLGKVYSLMFGPASGAFMRKWLVEDQKSLDLQMEDDKKGLGEGKKTYNYSYIKPLSAPVGPRQTKCNITMTLEQYDLNKAVCVLCSTQTPDVPSGNIFLTKTRYCLMWGPGNSTRLIMTFTVEWSGKSWLRGPIEKGANDGQMSYATAITAALRAAVTSRLAPVKAPGKGVRGKKRSKNHSLDEAPTIVSNPTPASQAKQSNWGIFDPLRGILGPIADILESLISPQIIIFILGALLIYTWFFRGGAAAKGPNSWSTTQRQVAHEEIWRNEESELWKWLEDRVAMDRVVVHHASAGSNKYHDDQALFQIRPETMQEREIDEAIRVTEERLDVLRSAVERERGKKRATSRKEERV
ncbi:hypothetical protein P153DRAFT_347333 [Dothidotthia symphoricarpi CBS 119687]|uniref:VASt domain-containing protein n=1 Tax=Dothidotthia symphoricarpi CBS 119687 TaxID=1392245 RepID=A0A6A6A555_9PLEO|nr:uncharacterized protein P153DRAFT_347333 [Dothidotthia symphoricarpi CBS 119687]KAF2126254.1 hypothetical protein P153DRAFT_347333 [Dothidotthia symphoricarpi CBS 119687]